MKKDKLILLLLAVGLVLWISGVATKLFISSEMLSGKNFAFAPPASLSSERILYSLIAKSTIMYILGFVLTLLFSILFIKEKKYTLKKEGWLLISILILIVFLPVELFTIWIDLKFIQLEFSQNVDINELRKLFVHRIHALVGAPYMALMGYSTIIIFTIFKPLKQIN